MQFRCPNCQHPIRIPDPPPESPDETVDTIECPSCHSRFSLSAEASATTLIVGTEMKIGHFEIHEVLGEGAFGTVLKAWDPELRRFVAIKVPREGRVSKDTARLFLREARAAAAISNPNVVTVHEVGHHGDSYYIACEFIDGISLSEQLKLRAFAPRETAAMLIKLLRAVQVFHDKSIIHRDLKPGNILLDRACEPFIADFGLARQESPNELTVTNSGRIVGTLLYMPPEQARGDNRNLSNRSDIYAMGVILYEMLTGQRPFQASSSRTLLHTILTVEPRPPRKLDPRIPRDLETICLKAIEKDPARRYVSASEMADDLQRSLDGQPIRARHVNALERTWRWAKRNTVIASLICVAVVLTSVLTYSMTRPADVRIVESPPEIRIVPPPPLTHSVSMSYQLSGNSVPPASTADWTVFYLTSRTREPDLDGAMQFRDQTSIATDLPPGEYLVVIDVKDFGFHEVYRTVPEVPHQEYRPVYRHQHWEVDATGGVVWPEVTVLRNTDVVRGMVEVPPGTFTMGDEQSDSPAHERSVKGFYADPTEVTVEQFRTTQTLPADYPAELAQDDWPLVMISWNAATAYAELQGKRLLKEYEFEYLATNLGQHRFPHGDVPLSPEGIWSYDAVGIPNADKMISLPIFGLHSNVAEWTDSIFNFYPGQPDHGLSADAYTHRLENRVVRGGPVALGDNDRTKNSCTDPTTRRNSWSVETRDTEIGFRCAVSPSPYQINSPPPAHSTASP